MRALVAGVLAVALVAGCSSARGQNGEGEGAEAEAEPQAGSPSSAPARRVEVATIQPSSGQLHLTLPGEVQGSRDALLAAALGGYVERVSVAEGEVVRRGAVLAQIDAASHRARLAQARVEREAAQRELERARTLGNALPRAQLDAAETRLAAAQAAFSTAQVAASRAVITAPFAGTVADVEVEVGEVAAPGAPVVRLVQLHPAHVDVTVPDRDVVALTEGMPARVRTDAQGRWHEGRIVRINPTANLRTRAFTVEIEVPNEDHVLLPGMIATVELRSEGETRELLVPQDWVVTRRDGLGVFVLEVGEAEGTAVGHDGVAKWQPVTLGRVIHDQVVVESGVEPGQTVVVTGHRELADGDPVLVSRSGTCCTDGRVSF